VVGLRYILLVSARRLLGKLATFNISAVILAE
jgi:hypothetical protein